jgi:hypothetical protein
VLLPLVLASQAEKAFWAVLFDVRVTSSCLIPMNFAGPHLLSCLVAVLHLAAEGCPAWQHVGHLAAAEVDVSMAVVQGWCSHLHCCTATADNIH